MTYLPAIAALIIGAAGWFYMFYSRAASNLSGFERGSSNRFRVRLRRAGGLMMIVLAFALYAGCVALEQHLAEKAAGYLMIVLLLMGAILILALIDLRMTNKLRREQLEQREKQDPP